MFQLDSVTNEVLLGHVAEQIVDDVSTLGSWFLSLLLAVAACSIIRMSEFRRNLLRNLP